MEDREVVLMGSRPFLDLLAVMLIGLKITGFVAWSWWIVFLPVLLPAVINLFIILFVLSLE